jgi:hypothetical protein
MNEADYYTSSENNLLAEDWTQNFMWSLIKEAED